MSLIPGSQQRSTTGLVVMLYSFAVFSGIAALIYEVSWTKMLALTFGRSTLAVTAVVGGFMVGMGIGAWLYHKVLGSRMDAIKLYAALEFGIALVTALLTPVFAALPEFFASLAGFVPAGLTMDLFRTAFVVVILLVPAALMGATFPALCTILIRSREGVFTPPRSHLRNEHRWRCSRGDDRGICLVGMDWPARVGADCQQHQSHDRSVGMVAKHKGHERTPCMG